MAKRLAVLLFLSSFAFGLLFDNSKNYKNFSDDIISEIMNYGHFGNKDEIKINPDINLSELNLTQEELNKLFSELNQVKGENFSNELKDKINNTETKNKNIDKNNLEENINAIGSLLDAYSKGKTDKIYSDIDNIQNQIHLDIISEDYKKIGEDLKKLEDKAKEAQQELEKVKNFKDFLSNSIEDMLNDDFSGTYKDIAKETEEFSHYSVGASRKESIAKSNILNMLKVRFLSVCNQNFLIDRILNLKTIKE